MEQRMDNFAGAGLLAEDMLLYHDLNEDGTVSKAEFCRNSAESAGVERHNQHEADQEKPCFGTGRPRGETRRMVQRTMVRREGVVVMKCEPGHP